MPKTVSERTEPVHRLAMWIVDVGPSVLLGGGTLVMGAASLTPRNWSIFLAVAAFAVVIIGGVWSHKRRPRLSRLERQIVQLQEARNDIIVALGRALREMMQEASIASSPDAPARDGNKIRATLACHISAEEAFVPLARHSDNPALAKFNRASYPDNQGLIGQGWQEGVASLRDLPEDRQQWNLHLAEEYGYSKSEAAGLSMHSRSLLALRIDWSTEHAGILVIESLKARGVTEAARTSIEQSAWYPSIRSLMYALRENVAPQIHESASRIST